MLEYESNIITSFTKEYAFLSNFYPVVIYYSDFNYATVEHAYVAAKSKDFMNRRLIFDLTADQAGKAKRIGRKFKLRDDWDIIKLSIMKRFLYQKFEYHDLREKLLATGDMTLIEGNYWHDNYWGNCDCGKGKCCNLGKNHLGKLLEEIREKIK